MHRYKRIDLGGEISLPCEARKIKKKKQVVWGQVIGLDAAHCSSSLFQSEYRGKEHFARLISTVGKKETISSAATWHLPLGKWNPLGEIPLSSEPGSGEGMSLEVSCQGYPAEPHWAVLAQRRASPQGQEAGLAAASREGH